MGASEYLSSKTEGKIKPLKSAFYTGSAYLLAVIFLISPYFLLDSLALSLISALGTAVLIIFLFNFYVSITNDLPFWKRFGEMTAISLGVAVFSFIIGLIIRNFLNI
jgi:VIT1/CCC1 family predicted Fe2+/Mn2+ transporter